MLCNNEIKVDKTSSGKEEVSKRVQKVNKNAGYAKTFCDIVIIFDITIHKLCSSFSIIVYLIKVYRKRSRSQGNKVI